MIDTFFVGHPTLNHRPVDAVAYLMSPSPEIPDPPAVKRRLVWSKLTWEERLELERLIAKAAA